MGNSESESFYNSLSTPLLIAELTEGKYKTLWVNHAFCRMTGFSLNDTVGAHPRTLLGHDLETPAVTELLNAIADGKEHQAKLLSTRKNGARFTCRVSVSPVTHMPDRFIEEYFDLTSCLEKEEGALDTPELLKLAMSGSADGHWCWRIGSDYCWFSSRIREMLLYEEDEFPNVFKSWEDAIHPDDRQRCLDAVQAHLKQNSPYRLEYRLRTKQGNYLWFESRGQSAPDSLEHMAGSLRDITQRRMAESELEAARDEALQASKLKTEFLANISHEIRTPLNGVIGMTNMLMRTSLNNEQQHFSKSIREAGKTLLSIMSDILDLSAIEAGQMRLDESEFDLRTTLESVAQLLAPQAHSKGLDLVTLASLAIPQVVRGDEERLKQILFNLTHNAVKFTDKGIVSIIAESEPVEKGSSRIFKISVIDTGCGISKEDLGKLFQSFVQLDGSSRRRHGGTGLGLAISQRIASLMGGVITATSQSGEGATFSVSVPLKMVKYEAVTPPLTGWNLCIVHSDERIRNSITLMAAGLGAASLGVSQVEDFVSQDFDAVFLPFEVSDQTLRQIMQTCKAECKFVLMRAAASAESRHLPEEFAENVSVLSLPFRRTQIIGLLKATTASQQTEEAKPAVKPGQEGVILVAEDHQVNQEVVKLYLADMGFDVDVVPDGNSAINAVVNNKRSYALVLMDCQMPEVDGYEATRTIREWEKSLGKHVPIIAMTAHSMEGDREKCLSAGMDDYISKPIEPDALQRILDTWKFKMQPSIEVAEALRRFGKTGTKTLLRLFLDDFPARCERMTKALEHKELAEFGDLAHGLMGASATIQANKLKAYCRKLEEAAKESNLEAATSMFETVKQELQALEAQAKTLLES